MLLALVFFGAGASDSSRTSPLFADTTPPAKLLKTRPRWACVDKCGACCYLKPAEREDLDSWLTAEERVLYESLVGEDGWCKHYDKERRLCGIYESRPSFCRCEADVQGRMFGVDEPFLDTFNTACCREHISDVYGAQSTEMRRFNGAIKQLRRRESRSLGEDTFPDDPR